MPDKVVSYTQKVVTAAELQGIHYDRIPTGLKLTVAYEIKDSTGAVRGVRTHTQNITLAAYPVSVAAILAALNTAQGT